MSDAYWTDYKVGEQLKIETRRSSGQYVTRNPIASAPEGAGPDRQAGTLTGLLAEGGIALACGVAFGLVIGRIASTDGINRTDAEAKARTLLVPGVILQPSGLFALAAAQQAGCGVVPGIF
jgi:hypothetical protein